MSALRLLLGPVLCLVAIPLTLVLLIASPWLGIVGVAVFAAGIVLSLEPAVRLENELAAAIDRAASTEPPDGRPGGRGAAR